MLSWWESVSWEMKIQLSMGWFLVFLIQASTKVSDVSKVAYIESLKRLEKCFRLLNTETWVENSVESPITAVKKGRLFHLNTDQFHCGLLHHCKEGINLCNTDKLKFSVFLWCLGFSFKNIQIDFWDHAEVSPVRVLIQPLRIKCDQVKPCKSPQQNQ